MMPCALDLIMGARYGTRPGLLTGAHSGGRGGSVRRASEEVPPNNA